jgi:MEKHLA domain
MQTGDDLRLLKMNSILKTNFLAQHAVCLSRSFKHWTGRELLAGVSNSAELAEKIFRAPFVLVSHGTESDPILNYGNAVALELWEMSWEELTRTPSRLTAETPDREERAKLLETAARRGFVDDYSGVRISKSGRRFKISRATVWNLLTEENKICGQAAMFRDWEFL